jgi:hypothetical protein
LKTQQAEEIAIDHLKKPDHGWTEATVRMTVQAAILLVLTAMEEEITWRLVAPSRDCSAAIGILQSHSVVLERRCVPAEVLS